MPTLILTDLFHWASSCSSDTFLYKGPASPEGSFQGCDGPQVQEAEGEAYDDRLEHCSLVSATSERCLTSSG